MPRIPRAVLLALSIAVHGQRLAAQESPASLTITVRDANGKALSEALTRAESAPFATTDSAGRRTIIAIRAGVTRIFASRIGFERGDTTITLMPGEHREVVLTLANLGARGETSRQILASLGAMGLTGDTLAQLNQRFMLSLRDRRDVTLKVANAIWVDSSRRLAPAFTRRIAAMNPIPVRVVRLDHEVGISQINAWASGALEGKIPVVLPKPFEDSTKFVVTNAIYLKAAWLVPFEKSRTIGRAFRSADGAVTQVPTMHDTRFLAYRRDSGWQAVRLPFRSGLTALYVILPDSGKALAPLLARFAVSGIPMPATNGAQREVELRLPRLHVEQELNLIPSMKRLGMRAAFDSSRADFTDLLIRVRDERLAVNLFKQQVFLDLDEEGAVAVAVSALGFVSITSSTPKPPPIHFFVDRPFLFLIQDERSQTTLFTGYIAKP